MDLKLIIIRETLYEYWHDLRTLNGVRSQKEYNFPEERLAYGFIRNTLKYRNFIELFEDLSINDSWLGHFGFENGQRRNYSHLHIMEIVNGDLPKNRDALVSHLKGAYKVSLGLANPDSSKITDHLHFRKTPSGVYLGSVRTSPKQLGKFSAKGFFDPKIIYVKADYFLPSREIFGKKDLVEVFSA